MWRDRAAGTEEQKHLVRYWEQPEIWSEHLNELDRVRVPETIAMIPSGVRTIVEVGCGNGRLLNRITGPYVLIGIDISRTALRQVKGLRITGSSSRLPLATGSVDLVICADVLEHLPEAVMWATVQELKRVARLYLLIGVPLEEPYEAAFVKCSVCGLVYNQFGHLRSFTCARLDRLFRDCLLVSSRFVGGPRKYYNRGLLWLQQRLGNAYWEKSGHEICPRCGSKEAGPPPRTFAQKVVAKACFLANECLDWLMPESWKPAHEVIRLYKKSRPLGGI